MLPESRYEAAQSREAAHDTLYTLEVLDRPHVHDGRNLLGVRLNFAFRHDKAEEHAPRNFENAFLGV
jgi:hypothetical protein